MNFRLSLIILFFIICGCRTDQPQHANGLLFKEVSSSRSRIAFSNDLEMTEEYNPYTFKNFLNGGGVAIGDINNDGLEDIYFTGNLVENKLYLNKGDFAFEDITEQAGVACKDVWSTGAAFVDINHDGYQDIFVCKSGQPDTPNRSNQLFINNGDLTFTDKAKELGLDFVGLSIHSAFFDYDKDGDLDCYLLNNSIRSVGAYDIAEGQRERASESGNKLLKNLEVETGELRFVDVSAEAGIYTSDIGFGLGVSVSDLNADSWPDIFVSNDFFEKDYLYLNQTDGTFKEVVDQSMFELSTGSMGADIADMNNDLRPDVFVTEMLPENLRRYKSKTVFESYEKNKLNKQKGYHNQYGRNVFQIHQGNKDNIPQFLELGRYHGVEATDWSWGALLFDMDNNGDKDIFIANGLLLDLLDQDHINFYDPQKIGQMVRAKKDDVIMTIMADFPREPLLNHFYLSDGTGHYTKAKAESFTKPSFSNGSAYADLDNDGDLDLVVNNVNQVASIYRNQTRDNHYLKIKLQGEGLNTDAIGSRIEVYAEEATLMQELNPMRGYQSCVSQTLVFGLGQKTKVDSMAIDWPNGKSTRLYNLKVDSLYQIDIDSAKPKAATNNSSETAIPLLTKIDGLINYQHKENDFPDFDRNRLLTHMLSNSGPKITVPLNPEKGKTSNTPDFIISGSKGQSCQAYINKNGSYADLTPNAFRKFALPETTEVLAKDLNRDGYLDYFLLNGGGENERRPNETNDILLLGQSEGFITQQIKTKLQSSAGVAMDIDGDGIQEVIVGSRMEPNSYGLASSSLIYKLKDNQLSFDKNLSASLKDLGMVKDLLLTDIDKDGIDEVLFVRDYNSIAVFKLVDKQLVKFTVPGLETKKGIWNKVLAVDVDQDGDQDLIACNFGINNRFQNMAEGSFYMIVGDLDNNERVDVVHCVKRDGKYFPIHLKDEIMMQMPKLKKKSLKYSEYAIAAMTDLVGELSMSKAQIYEVNEMRSGIFMNEDGSYKFVPLPNEIQYSEQFAVCSADINGDGYVDLIMGGNQYEAKPELGINAASFGHVLLNDGMGQFVAINHESSGFFEKGQIRDIVCLNLNGERHIIVAKNNNKISTYKING